MVFRFAYLLPILISIWFPFTFIVTYLLALKFGDVRLVFPYISDTGNWTPESCFFGLMLNIGAILMGLIIYVRYRQVKEILSKHEFNDSLKPLNFRLFILGEIASFGVILVGNFQETEVFVVHMLGASMAFGLGSIYQVYQAYLSFKIYPKLGNKQINIARAVCAAICCFTVSATGITGAISLYFYDGEFKKLTLWGPENGGYWFHVVSAINEWILAMTTMVFLLLFQSEFRLISFTEPLILLSAT